MFGYVSQATMTKALKFVSATAAMGISYVQIVWALILGYCIFHEVGSCSSLHGCSQKLSL